jgi:endo-1,4-beta-xylanase
MKAIATTMSLRVAALTIVMIGLNWPDGVFAQQGFGPPVNTNGSFEDTEPGEKSGYDIEGWLIEVGESVPAPPTFTVVDVEDAPDGNHVLRVDVADIGANAWNIQIVADSLHVVPGESYRFWVWARADGPYGQVSLTVGNYAFNEYGRIGDTVLSEEWQEYAFDFTIGDDQTVIRAPIHFNYDGNIDTPVYVDHLRIARTTVDDELARPVIVEAESGEVGDQFDVLEDDTLTFVRVITDWWDDEGPGQPQWSRPVSSEHVITYEVTFPGPGVYNLFARVRVNQQDQEGRTPPSNDSFFFPDGFGEKSYDDAADWSFVNQLDAAAGWTEPSDVVHERGSASSGVWKWINISNNTYGNQGFTYEVPADQLTQTFQIAGRETYLDIDKLAFGLEGLYFTVRNLDHAEPGSIEWPEDLDPVTFYEGPPMATGHAKYLGNIYSPSQVTTAQPHFEHYWNQVAPENAGKWGSVQPTNNPDPSTWSWGALDNAYNLAKDNGWPFRFHVLVWGSQQPNWISGLTEEEQREAVRNWFQAVADRYDDIDRLEVVNEPIPQPPPYREALGGSGDTGWDWIITAFEMAREIFPEHTRLMINDYGILSGGAKTTQYLDIISLLIDRGLIDAIGVQGHHFTLQNITPLTLRNTLDRLGETGLPIIVTELDIAGRPSGDADVNDPTYPQAESDQIQREVYERVFPVIWEHPAVEGVTLWGWKLGSWRPGRQMHLIRANGSERPALTWMREYLAETATSVEDTELPRASALLGNYPNPFSRFTELTYELSTPAEVRLDVYDMLGRHVRTVVRGSQHAGQHAITFHADGLSSGMYFYRLRAGETVETRQMTVIR